MARVIGVPTEKKKLISYRYEATTGQGKLAKGTIKAVGEIEAERQLIAQGYIPLNVTVAPSMLSLEEAFPTLFQVKPRDVILFSRQLATLLRAGISLLPSLEILLGQVTTSRAFKKVLQSVADDLRSGSSFSQATAKHPKAFNDIYCRTIAVGEQTGNMEMVLTRMADYIEKQGAIAKKIGGALTYPMIVLGVGFVVSIIMMTVVMPQLLSLFASVGTALPLPTRILMGISKFLSTHPLQLLIVGAVIIAAVVWLVKQPTGRWLLDGIKLRAPLIGVPTLMAELARFSRTTSMLITAGLSLQEIMEIVPQSSQNRVIREALKQVSEGLLLGEGLSGPMTRQEIFPPLLVQMVAVGEQSNTLDFTLGVVADFYETTSEERMGAVVGMIGPMSTIIIAVVVGFIAISVIMPMYTITGSFG